MKTKITEKKQLEKESLNDLKIDIGLQILELRLIKDVTQAKLAKLIGTQQPSIARAERGATIPSLTFLNKIAVALNTRLTVPEFEAVRENEINYELKSATWNFTLTPYYTGFMQLTSQETKIYYGGNY